MRFPWRVTTRRARHRPLVQVPFLGGQALVETLATHLQAAQHGRPQFLSIVGEAGAGKTALLEEFRFLHCSTPNVLLLQINAASCLLAPEFYRQLCTTLRERSTDILQTAYNATQRLRKTLTLRWDAREFQHMLASAEWAQFHSTPPPGRGGTGRSASPLTQILMSVQEHPWAMGAAAVLSRLESRVLAPPTPHLWEQSWQAALKTLQGRYRSNDAVMVLLIDQVSAPYFATDDETLAEQPDWPAFATALAALAFPVLLIWTGTPASRVTLPHAMAATDTYAQYTLEPLDHEAHQQLVQHTIRALPRSRQTAWQQALVTVTSTAQAPGWFLLATCNAVALQEQGQADTETLRTLAQADTTTLVQRLVDHIRTRTTMPDALRRQIIEICAFMPPNAHFVIDDILPWCDFAAFGLDIVTGRGQLETLLGQCARYGLLRYDPYASRYTLGDSTLQEALQRVAHPEAAVRRQMVRQWALANAILRHVRQGARLGLADVARLGLAEYGEAMGELLAPLVLAPFRRLLPMSTREERQRMAYALGGFPLGLAVDMLRGILQDEDGQVRSSAVQSLADLAIAATLPGLLDALKDSNSDVRWIATQALGHMTSTRAVDALIPMLTDEDKEVGRIAAQGLGQQGDSRAVPHLIAATRDSYPLLRESAISALGNLADRRAIPALQEVLQDANQQVRRSAEIALARFAVPSGG